MQLVRHLDARPNHHLYAAEDKQPGTPEGPMFEEKHNASGHEIDAKQQIIDDVNPFVALLNDYFSLFKVDVDDFVTLLNFNFLAFHFISPTIQRIKAKAGCASARTRFSVFTSRIV